MWWRTEWEGQKQPQRPSTGQSQIYQDERFGSWAECFYIQAKPSLSEFKHIFGEAAKAFIVLPAYSK